MVEEQPCGKCEERQGQGREEESGWVGRAPEVARGADFDIGLTPDRRERRREGGGGEAGRTGRPFLCGEAEFD